MALFGKRSQYLKKARSAVDFAKISAASIYPATAKHDEYIEVAINDWRTFAPTLTVWAMLNTITHTVNRALGDEITQIIETSFDRSCDLGIRPLHDLVAFIGSENSHALPGSRLDQIEMSAGMWLIWNCKEQRPSTDVLPFAKAVAKELLQQGATYWD